MAGSNEVVDVTMTTHVVTDRAVLVSDTGIKKDAVWLPLSQIELVQIGRTGCATVTMPEWLAKEHGLI